MKQRNKQSNKETKKQRNKQSNKETNNQTKKETKKQGNKKTRKQKRYRVVAFDISADDEFCYACSNGQLEVAQWLLTVKPEIDISSEKDWAFRSACANGHLEVADGYSKSNQMLM